jgi:hypothetical protein
MDNESLSKFILVIHDITAQPLFLTGIQDMISRINGTPTHIFDEMLHCLAKLNAIVCEFQHVYEREADIKLQREWLERQRGRQVHIEILIGVVFVISLVVLWNRLHYV